ncbi:FMN-binding negative transcriptional regulator [Profundibacter amoris]|uniref:FMN-binding negative transcriptional regulator n=1 Tax=Profundibacter amoris TaxID=2171755 RepID=A0A347UCS4_9RHOB|nr:FMN-binding negative transcriptional regulator [Profundibacter amoris]AXX96652.1 FMN-binding negative transcriptional regulator [Profundibacter amoris]
MHPNPAFCKTPAQTNLDFARERGFGILSINGDPAPLIAHIPFALSDDGKTADLHLVRSNPIAHACTGTMNAVIAVSGPDSYISPDWYGADDLVPTWNYTAIHLRGTLTRLLPEDLRASLDTLAAQFENRLLPKPPWSNAKMPPEALAKMMRMITPFRFDIETVDGTWKLGQNKPESARLSAAQNVQAYGIGSETALLAALMMAPDTE